MAPVEITTQGNIKLDGPAVHDPGSHPPCRGACRCRGADMEAFGHAPKRSSRVSMRVVIRPSLSSMHLLCMRTNLLSRVLRHEVLAISHFPLKHVQSEAPLLSFLISQLAPSVRGCIRLAPNILRDPLLNLQTTSCVVPTHAARTYTRLRPSVS